MIDFSKLLFWRKRKQLPEIEEEEIFPRIIPLIYSLSILIRSRLWLQILTGMALGIGLGLLLSPEGISLVSVETAMATADWLGLPGRIFLSLIQMIVVALVMCSIILGISSGDLTTLRRLGIRIVPYYLATTLIAVIIGISVVTIMEPAEWIDRGKINVLLADTGDSGLPVSAEVAPEGELKPLPQRLADIIPSNPLKAALDLNMFHVVTFSILMGIAVATLHSRKHADLLLEITASILEVAMRVVSWAMFIAPLAVFGLFAQLVIKTGVNLFAGMGMYIGTVLVGLLVLLLLYCLMVLVLAKRNPLTFLKDIKELQLLAFSTSSSAAVIPVSINTAIRRIAITPEIARFLIPLGATVNMDGTALYQVIAAVFLTRIFGIELDLNDLILLTMTTVGASIGTPSTPGVGIVILATIVAGIGVPLSGIALIIGVDRILDMSRTAINVTGDLVACTVMDRWLGTGPATGADRQVT